MRPGHPPDLTPPGPRATSHDQLGDRLDRTGALRTRSTGDTHEGAARSAGVGESYRHG